MIRDQNWCAAKVTYMMSKARRTVLHNCVSILVEEPQKVHTLLFKGQKLLL